MEAVKGNWENRKNEAESALRRLITVRKKEPQPSLLVLQRKVDEMKKEVEKFGYAQGVLLEKGSGKLTDEERTNYVKNYDELGDKMHEELDIALEMVQSMENPVLFLLWVTPLAMRNLLSQDSGGLLITR